MKQDVYRERMTQTSEAISGLILQYLAPLEEEHPALYAVCSELNLKKVSTFETRAYFMRFSYEACTKKSWTDDARHACAAIELELASMYYTNRIFDDKGGKHILDHPHEQVIAAMVTHGLATDAIMHACRASSYGIFKKIMKIFEQVNKQFYIGQYFEISNNIFQKNTRLDWDMLTKDYYHRAYGVNASYYEKIATIACLLGDGDEKKAMALSQFGHDFGIAQQIVNDVSDFVPPKQNSGTEEKLPEDAYSDLRHRKLTLPVIYTLVRGSDEDRRKLTSVLSSKRTVSEKTAVEITTMLMNNGAIPFAQKEAKRLMNSARNHLITLNPEFQEILGELCFIAYTNRFYKALQSYKNKI